MPKFPYAIKRVDEATNKELLDQFIGENDGFVFVEPHNYCYPAAYEKFAEEYYNTEVRPDDVWIVTYPRSGTTVMQEVVWQIRNGFNFQAGRDINIFQRSPFFEFHMVFHHDFLDEVLTSSNYHEEAVRVVQQLKTPGYEKVKKMLSPRTIKSHLPLCHLPPTLLDDGKVVYVARNPKDVAVSFYYHNQLFRAHDYQGDFPQYWDLYERELLEYSPHWQHVLEAWEKRNHKNMCFVFYEDFIKDPQSTINYIADFLGVKATPEQIKALADHVHIENFKKNVNIMYHFDNVVGLQNKKAKPFIRQGKVLANKAEWTPELEARADMWIKHLSKGNDLVFPI